MTRRAPHWRAREPVSAAKLNRVSSEINDLAKGRFSVTPVDGTGNTRIILLEVLTIDDGLRTMDCVIPGTSGVPVPFIYTVSLPQLFTETTRTGGFQYTYSTLNARAQTAPAAEDQEITPNLIVGDEIVARDLNNGLSWVWAPDGRMWASVTP